VVVMALLGQLTFSVVIDQFGLFEAIKSPVSRQKIIGLIIMSIGVILIKLA
jgi:transporter family-2 protein